MAASRARYGRVCEERACRDAEIPSDTGSPGPVFDHLAEDRVDRGNVLVVTFGEPDPDLLGSEGTADEMKQGGIPGGVAGQDRVADGECLDLSVQKSTHT